MKETALSPKLVFDCFAAVNRVPRPSKREEKMIAFLKDFGESHGLPTEVDETGNVIIRKAATQGFEDRKTIILQSHMDMVCEKVAGSSFNFLTDAIETEVEGEWLHAKDTTLGADDGIGVAMQMALLLSSDVEHGPLECVFTRDEETGLTGAMGMKSGFMKGDMLINLDSEDEGQIFVSCAGGARTTATFHFKDESLPSGFYTFRIGVKGLTGGHSGDDINKKRANANKILSRFLCESMEKYDLRLVDIQSGGLHNAIPRDGEAVCALPEGQRDAIRADFNVFVAAIEEEYHVTEPLIQFCFESETPAATAIEQGVARRLVLALQAVHNGMLAMSQDLDTLVETSSNLASVRRAGTEITVITSERSSIDSARRNMSRMVRAAFALAGAEVETGEGYPGWKMNPDSQLLKISREAYVRLFGKEPLVLAIHAGLECGLFSEKYPALDMISVGPTLRGVHSPDEKLLIPTVQMVWDFVLEILRSVPRA